MNVFKDSGRAEQYDKFTDSVENIIKDITPYAKTNDVEELKALIKNFRNKVNDFYRQDRKLNIGIIGRVKAGKSSFLNTLLFDGKTVLPKASTPKTATLTKMEYSDENIIQVEYYSEEEWKVIEENASVDIDNDIYNSAREILKMVSQNGINPADYLKKGSEKIKFDTYENLINSLNDYVGEDGKITPLVKDVVLYMNNEAFKGISIVDTPGLNDPIASRTIKTKEFIEVCDVVFFLSVASQFVDQDDWNLLSGQLPQKGAKKLVLIASKFDSGIRDVLKEPDEDDIFGDDENTASNIPDAYNLVKKSLRRRAKSKVDEFASILENQEKSPELVELVKQCRTPIMASSMVHNMCGKDPSEYDREEMGVYNALKAYSKDIKADLELLGSFDEVTEQFRQAVSEKEEIFDAKERTFLPDAKAELDNILGSFIEKTESRIKLLNGSGKSQLEEQKQFVQNQIGNIKNQISELFGDLNIKLENKKAQAVKDIRGDSEKYMTMKERVGERTYETSHWVSTSHWYNPFSWGSGYTSYRTHVEHYNYLIASDAAENLGKYAIESTNKVESVFTESLQLKELKRRLLNVVIQNFDMGSEKYDSALFKTLVEETVAAVEFPVFKMDTTSMINKITGNFAGEITDKDEMNKLNSLLASSISGIYSEICDQLVITAKNFKQDMNRISKEIYESLTRTISDELDELISQCEDKDREIADYEKYAALLKVCKKSI